MRLKRTDPDSCGNCTHCNSEYKYIENLEHQALIFRCNLYDKEIKRIEFGLIVAGQELPKFHLTELICEDGYEDDGSRFLS